MNVRNIFFLAISTLLATNVAFASSACLYTGNAPVAVKRAVAQTAVVHPEARAQIAAVLEAESRMTYVRDAMAIKETGLAYAKDISDFEYLASYAFANPSEAYRLAVANFVANNIAAFVNSPLDLTYVQSLETKAINVSQAIAVKNAGMRGVRTIDDFLAVIPFSVANPSDAYRDAVSTFVASNVQFAVNEATLLNLIVSAEGYTRYVKDAIAVKNAGLVAVHSKRELLALAQFANATPSEAYREAVNAFIRDNIGRYPQ